ncbi:CynX/NimT family MFS transporter [Anditalea andensis]|uniref:Transporter n=1 Tax=Anditalea andensis TaxID=1048983 RepID=A0A074KY53_9BACT|nr:MFS transporter [Anditalea andensis]KEO73105.1 transporter [Anditalea andensis]
MTISEQKSPSNTLLILGIIIISFNLRPSITAVGPLLPLIREDLDLSNAWAGFLTTLPLLTFATFSLFSSAIGRKLGNARAILLGMVIIGLGTLIRVMGGTFFLFFGTALTGIGIVIGNVLLIPFIKVKLPHKIGLMTSMYTTGMTLMAAVASGVSIPLAKIPAFGWRGSLLFWMLLILMGILFWLPQIKKHKIPVLTGAETDIPVNIWKSRLAWQVSIFMGVQSLIFFSLITWLPDMLMDRNFTASQSGYILSGIQIVGLGGSFLAPLIAVKFKDQVVLGALLGIGYLLGFTALFFESKIILYSGLTVIGLCLGSSISLAYTLIGLRTYSDKTTASLSGMAQSIGYFLAAIGPLIIGILIDIFADWRLFLGLMMAASAVFLFLATRVGRAVRI